MKLILSDSETIALLQALKEKKQKHQNLSALAGSRSGKRKFIKNAAQLRSDHKSKAEVVQNLITRITNQL